MRKKAVVGTLRIYQCEIENLYEFVRENLKKNPTMTDALLKTLKDADQQLQFLISLLSERR